MAPQRPAGSPPTSDSSTLSWAGSAARSSRKLSRRQLPGRGQNQSVGTKQVVHLKVVRSMLVLGNGKRQGKKVVNWGQG